MAKKPTFEGSYPKKGSITWRNTHNHIYTASPSEWDILKQNSLMGSHFSYYSVGKMCRKVLRSPPPPPRQERDGGYLKKKNSKRRPSWNRFSSDQCLVDYFERQDSYFLRFRQVGLFSQRTCVIFCTYRIFSLQRENSVCTEYNAGWFV